MQASGRQDAVRVLEPEEQKHPGDLTLTLVYYRLKRPDDSKRECEIVQRLTAEAEAKPPGVKQSEGKLQ